ncbi:MAG: acyltransferase family protein [Akkermansia sp.]|nr:acyltransferase family protein [Akkermansia sp.]
MLYTSSVTQNNQKKYIQHLVGVRGIAILMVILFHMCPQYFSNGFYGVDIFFVITGYLLFYGKQTSSPFSFFSFIKKKLLRVYPSLCVLILFAGISMIPFLYDTLIALTHGKNCLYSLLGFSNIFYIKVYSNYFAADSNMNPLLHTWYLSATIQIYLLWAIGQVLLQQTSVCTQRVCLCFIAIASLVYCLSFTLQQLLLDYAGVTWGQDSAVSYYDPLGRLWQILAGGLVCVLPLAKRQWVNCSIGVTSLAILCIIAFCNYPLPAWISILVVVCTVLILKYAGEVHKLKLFENPPLLFLGKISFSLYLVHFPILVFYRHWERSSPNLFWLTILLLTSILCAWALWRWVETSHFSRRGNLILFTSALFLACFVRGVFKLGLHWDMRDIKYPVYNLSSEHTNYHPSVHIGYDDKLLKGEGGTQALLRAQKTLPPILSLSGIKEKPQFVLIGNSVAQQLYAGFHEIAKQKKISGIHLTTIIFPLWNVHCWLNDSYCWTEEKANAFIDWLKQQPDIHTIVVSYLWKSEFSQLSKYTTWGGQTMPRTPATMHEAAKDFCTKIKEIGKHVVFLTPTPVFMEFEDKSLLGKGEDYVQWRKQRKDIIAPHNEEDPFVISKKEYMSFNEEIFTMLHKLESEGYCKLLHIEHGIFQDGNFSGLHKGVLFGRDKTHITPPASIYILQKVADEFEEIIKHNQANIHVNQNK